jgi:hypothetical protein
MRVSLGRISWTEDVPAKATRTHITTDEVWERACVDSVVEFMLLQSKYERQEIERGGGGGEV